MDFFRGKLHDRENPSKAVEPGKNKPKKRKTKIMGDSNPKNASKKAGQKQAKVSAAGAKKQQAAAAAKAPAKKK